MIIRKINSQNETDIEKFMKIRKISISEDENFHNLMTYGDEEKDFSVAGYKKFDFLKNYFIAENGENFIAYGTFHSNWPRNFQ